METKRVLKTNFPPVLSQYLPVEVTVDARDDAVDSEAEEADEKEDETRQSGETATVKFGQPEPSESSVEKSGAPNPKPTPRTQPPQREKTSMSLGSLGSGKSARMKKQEAERFEHVAEVWEQARTEVLSERHAQLQEKLLLQQQLVRAQDIRAEQLRQQQELQQLQKRQEEKKKKQAKEAALQQICKQSLDEDKKKAAEQRRARKPYNNNNNTNNPAPTTPSSYSDANSDLSDNTSNTASTSTTNERGRSQSRHRGYRPSEALPERQLASSPMKEQEAEEAEAQQEEEEEARRSWSSGRSQAEVDALPKHHAQLYQLYGKQADYFLHPQPAKAAPQRRPTHPKLKNQKVVRLRDESGHISAGELWDTLRQDSVGKLIRNDQRFPQELKSAFSSFVRERLTKHSRPVQRSFCATEDVPDIQRLMDQSKLRRARMFRHKAELMYRSSVNNSDRTTILLHNNPLPDITELGGQADSISRYLPSWVDDQSEVSEAEYMKWIQSRRQAGKGEDEEEEEDKENVRHSAHSRHLSETTNELQSIWQAISTRHKKPKTPRYQFLTEKEAECEGVFTQRFQEEKQQRDKPQPHHVAKSYSALEFSHPASSLAVSPSRERGRSAHSLMQLQRFQSDWQPLSLTALIEYKKQVETEGEGDFQHGRMKMWPVVVASSTSA